MFAQDSPVSATSPSPSKTVETVKLCASVDAVVSKAHLNLEKCKPIKIYSGVSDEKIFEINTYRSPVSKLEYIQNLYTSFLS